MKHHVTIYWTCSRVSKVKIMARFGIQDYTNVGGETEAWITDEDWEKYEKEIIELLEIKEDFK